jgi:hypothetical protein
LEDRAEKACFLLFVDDATSEILAAEFLDHESFWSYSAFCKRYFRQYGLPKAFYTDRFSVFRVNQTNVTTTAAQTMFEQAMNALGIELICASSLQAKWRLEHGAVRILPHVSFIFPPVFGGSGAGITLETCPSYFPR